MRLLSWFSPFGAMMAGWLEWIVPAAVAPLDSVGTWGVYYGATASISALQRPDLLVLEGDHPWEPARFRRPGQRILAYLSLGEVHKTRAYFAQLAASNALAGANPAWPDARRIDPRAAIWRTLLLDQEAPRLLAKGYDGFFFDTLDVAAALEAAGTHPGALRAMGDLIVAIRTRFPTALLVANGGSALLDQVAPTLNGLAVESVFTDYQFKPGQYSPRNAIDARQRQMALQTLHDRWKLPIFDLEYVAPDDHAARARIARQVTDAGFIPFIADIGLQVLDAPP